MKKEELKTEISKIFDMNRTELISYTNSKEYKNADPQAKEFLKDATIQAMATLCDITPEVDHDKLCANMIREFEKNKGRKKK